MWTSSESYQPYDSNNIASKTITRCDAIEEESDSDKSPLIHPSGVKVSLTLMYLKIYFRFCENMKYELYYSL